MKAKLIRAIYHYKNHQITIHQNMAKLCGFAVEFKYAHLFEDIGEIQSYVDEDLVNWGYAPDTEISSFSVDELDETIIYHNNIDMDKKKSILKFLMDCIDESYD
jgi:hypothetical protein